MDVFLKWDLGLTVHFIPCFSDHVAKLADCGRIDSDAGQDHKAGTIHGQS